MNELREYNFPTKELWEDFVNSLDLNNPQIALLVDECNILREHAGYYYDMYVLKEFDVM